MPSEQLYRSFMAKTSWHVDEMIYHGENKLTCWWDDLSWWEQAYMLMRWFIMARTSWHVDEMIYHGENKLTCWWDDLSWREQAYMLMRRFMVRTSLHVDEMLYNGFFFVLDQHVELHFYSASSLKHHQSMGSHVATLRHIILIPSKPVFPLSP